MSVTICIFLCVTIICITCLVLQIVEKYPQWSTYYEYKQKAKLYDDIVIKDNKDIIDTVKSINNIQDYINKDSRHAYNLLEVILQIKIALKETSTVKAVERIKTILDYGKL